MRGAGEVEGPKICRTLEGMLSNIMRREASQLSSSEPSPTPPASPPSLQGEVGTLRERELSRV